MVIEESILPLNDPRTFLSIDSTFMIYQLQGTTHTRNMLLLTYSEVLICYQQGSTTQYQLVFCTICTGNIFYTNRIYNPLHLKEIIQ